MGSVPGRRVRRVIIEHGLRRTLRTAGLIAVAAILAACDESPRAAPPSGSAATTATLAVDTIASGLSVPWALAFAADGRIFVTERPGRIRVIERGQLRAEPWATLSVAEQGEAGLM